MHSADGYGYCCKGCIYKERTNYVIKDFEGEVWKSVNSVPGLMVSNKGRVKRVKTQCGNPTEKLLKVREPEGSIEYRRVFFANKTYFLQL